MTDSDSIKIIVETGLIIGWFLVMGVVVFCGIVLIWRKDDW